MNWNSPSPTAWPEVQPPDGVKQPWPLQAKEHCCEEASLQSGATYIPCNAPAVNIVGWIGRSEKPIRMCQFCSNHNVANRGGEIKGPYIVSLGSNEGIIKQWPSNPVPSNPLDVKSEDEFLMLWADKKKAIEVAKEEEMELRKYIVGRAFPQKNEGMNTKELGNGYQLKAAVKYNYNLADNDKVEECLNYISDLGNDGPFIADRLVGWTPSFKVTEYRLLCEAKDKGEERAIKILDIVNKMLTITEAAPTLEIKSPKTKK